MAWTGLDMIPMLAIITAAWILSIVLLWRPFKAQHKIGKAIGTVLLTGATALAAWWVCTYDRPILLPQIGGLLTQNYNGSALGIDIEALIKNTGRQSGYADRWKLLLTIDGTTIEGKQLYGQSLPSKAANEPQLYDQELPPGKPVRGWLFFGFPTISHEFATPYFLCNSPLIDKVSIKLSLWDSKMKREWNQSKPLKDLGKEACAPLDISRAVPPVSARIVPSLLPQVRPKAPESPTLPNIKIEAPLTQKNDGPCGINNIGGIVSGNTCVTTPPQRTIDTQALERAVSILKKAPGGSKFNIVVTNGNDETDKLADQIQQMLIKGKWEQQSPRRDTKGDGTINGRRLIIEGVTCDFGKTEVMSHKFAEDAMAAAGYPCQATVPEYIPQTEIIHGEPYIFEKVLADIYIRVAPAAPIH